MRSVAVVQPGEIEIVEVPKPTPGPYDVLVKTEISFICNVTDRELIEGTFPGMGPEAYPLLLGHEAVGRVVEVGTQVTTFAKGDRTIGGLVLDPPGGQFKSGWGGHSDYVIIKDHLAMEKDGVADEAHGWNEVYKIMRKVPDDIPIEAAGMLCIWREVYSGFFHDFGLSPDNELLVFGAGPVGLSFIKFAKLRGFTYVGSVDPLAGKREKALAMGADEVFAPDDPKLSELPQTRAKPLDAIVDAVGLESIINQGLPLIKMGGSICVFGVVAAPKILLEKYKGPYNFNLLMHQWPTRDAERAAQEPLIEWIRSGALDWKDFVSSKFSINDVKEAVAETRKATNIKTMLIF